MIAERLFDEPPSRDGEALAAALAPCPAVQDEERREARQRPSHGQRGDFAAAILEMARAEVAERRRYARQWPVQAPDEELVPLAALDTPPPGSRLAPTTVRDAPRVAPG